ncbi:MAG: ABC transporter ATP-binding protein [Acutalibacteraceae bacterium]|jgi:teichoic acid transport system ATP-binding protein
MSEIAIRVKDLWIEYRTLKPMSLRQSLFSLKKNKMEITQAVKGVSFEVEKGKIVGIIGKNGSGKSTLLRAIAGIFSANSGSIELFGHSVSLLSIGVGFQNQLSGRENIMLSGLLMGFKEEEILEKMEEIISFSGLGKYIDMPVKSYSSGMFSKLAFSITAILETDIILIDEVLSVGDAAFKKKSYNKMHELISNADRTVLIVSHDIGTLRELCDEVIWIQDGVFIQSGDPNGVLTAYEEHMGTK